MSTPYPHPTGAYPTAPQPATASSPARAGAGYPTASSNRPAGPRAHPAPLGGSTPAARSFGTQPLCAGAPDGGSGKGVPSYALYCVFALSAPMPRDEEERERIVDESLGYVSDSGAQIRGWYDLGGFRANADLMVWLLNEDPATLQDAYHRLRASALGRHLTPVWSCMGVHQPAEFLHGHVPACFLGADARDWATVFPLVGIHDWYLIEPGERSRIVADYGRRGFGVQPDVDVSVLCAFALSDYEYVIAIEADNLDRLEGVTHAQRYSEARPYVREDTPFFTGPRVTLAQWARHQPRS